MEINEAYRGILEENLRSGLQELARCKCPESGCEVSPQMHDFFKKYLQIGQDFDGSQQERGEFRPVARSISVCSDSGKFGSIEADDEAQKSTVRNSTKKRCLSRGKDSFYLGPSSYTYNLVTAS